MPGTTAVGLSEYVRVRRLRAGLTQDALAERAGITVDTVGALERGLRRRLYPHTARAITDALGLKEDERAELVELAHGRPGVGTATATPLNSSGAEPSPATHNLPALLTDLIGRERELSQILERLPQHRVLTLTGPGGVGKTRLALEGAHALLPRYPDGVWLVDLAPLTDSTQVLAVVASALGVREGPDGSLLETLCDALKARDLLLLLDNCEQVLDSAPEIAALLAACPAIAVIATSRAPLRISGEHELLVSPLPVPSAREYGEVELVSGFASVRLFVERAAAVKADFSLTAGNAPAVADICARLEGLPLAIELAAARVRIFSPESLLARLEHRLGVLTGGPNDRPARQRTLRNAIAWSYELLTPAERALFCRLGVFAGGFTLDAAEAIYREGLGPVPDLLEALESLVNNSLLRVEDGGGESASGMEPRFAMFETLREFALEQLATGNESQEWHERHLQYYLGLMEAAEHDLQETAPISTVLRTRRLLEPEQGNLRSALTWAIAQEKPEYALRLAASLSAVWVPAGNLKVARRWLDQSGVNLGEARRWLEQTLAMDGGGLPAARARAHYGLGRVSLFQWDDPWSELDFAIRAFEQSLLLYRELDDRHGIAQCLLDLGAALFDRNDVDRAAAAFQESLALCRSMDDPIGIGWSLVGLGRIAQSKDELEQAAFQFEDALELQRGAGNLLGMAAATDGLGLVRQAQRNYPEALRYFEEAVALRRVIGAQSGLPIALQRLAVILGVAGDLPGASELMRESLVLSHRMANPFDTANCLLTLGSLAAGAGSLEQGARLIGAGEALLAARRLVVPPGYRHLHERSVAGVRRSLGDEAFASAFAAGAALTLDEAIAEALLGAAPEPATEKSAPQVSP